MDFLQLAGKRFLIFGVANRKSVAYHVGQVLAEAGAICVYVVRDDAIRDSLSGLLGGEEIHVCDVEHETRSPGSATNPSPLGRGSGQRTGHFHGLLHSIAFADYSAGPRPFHGRPRPTSSARWTSPAIRWWRSAGPLPTCSIRTPPW